MGGFLLGVKYNDLSADEKDSTLFKSYSTNS